MAETDAKSGSESPNDRESLGVAVGGIIAGKFKVDRILGEGGMGVVVLATHLALDEKFAIKLLRRELAAEPDIVERFSREAKACVKIKSEHVARVHDVGMCEDGTPFMVMEYLVGSDLGSAIAHGPLQVEEAVDYVIQACEALSQAHALGIVHRDIKPENLFLVSHAKGGWRSIKVLDFGISKATLIDTPLDDLLPEGFDQRALENPTRLAGTPRYMSPEQVQRSPHVDCRSDVWSLGVVLYELLTTRAAWRGDSVHEIASSILAAEPPRLEDFRPDVPYGLSRVIERCLEKDPAKRYAGVAELAVELLPYAPRRARVAAERATQVARAAGLAGPDLKIPTSVFPPSLSQLAIGPTAIPPPPSLPAVSRDAPTMPDVSVMLESAPPKRPGARMLPVAALAGTVLLVAAMWTLGRSNTSVDTAANPSPAERPTTAAPSSLASLPSTYEPPTRLDDEAPAPATLSSSSLAGAAPSTSSAATAAPRNETAGPRRDRQKDRPSVTAPLRAHTAESDAGEPDLGY